MNPKFYILIVHDVKIDFLLIVRSEHRGKENWSLLSQLTVRCDWRLRGCGEVGIRIGRGVFFKSRWAWLLIKEIREIICKNEMPALTLTCP